MLINSLVRLVNIYLLPAPENFFSLVYKWLVWCILRRICTMEGVLLNARSSNAKVNKAVEIQSLNNKGNI